MIFWIASYPKSGNTWLRSLIGTYYYSKDGIYNESLLKKIDQFPTKKYFEGFEYNQRIADATCKLWIKAQEKINTNTNELKFFKTHNAFGKLNNYDFTDAKNSAGCLYIVRDPRNVFTSLKNHYQLSDQQAIKWMTNDKNFIYYIQKFEENGYSDFQFISSWNIHYKSWKIQKKIPIKFIRYEDLQNQTYFIFVEIIKFINNISNINEKIDTNKIKKILRTTSFEKLKQHEADHGFSEAVSDKKDRNKKISFFNLGPKNNWREILSDDIRAKLENIFEKDLKELSYKKST